MIGIVVVSHSPALAEAAVALAAQMGGDDPPAVRVAAGTPDGGFGTDAVAIAAAIDAAASGDGVLVIMDLGSAILSTELALDFTTTSDRVELSAAPFVEGLVSAVVVASTGAGIDAVAAEVRGALAAKRAQLGEPDAAAPAPGVAPGTAAPGTAAPDTAAPDTAAPADEAAFEGVVRNPSGLHARPAAAFARAAGRYDAAVEVTDLDGGSAPVSGKSLIALMALGVRPGTRVRVSATGADAREAVAELRELVESGFGEL